MAGLPQRKQPTVYKKPKKLNAVSITLGLILLATAYFVYCTYPVFNLRLRAKSELEDVLPDFWRANLRPEAFARTEIARIKKDLLVKLAKAGVKDKKVELVFDRGKKRVAIEAHFTTTAYFPVIDKTHTFELAPRAETDAARVDW
jgi:hypothetical protein